jgi:histidine triad (HIT) family protein
MSDTIFDKILSKKIPAKIVYEDQEVLAFHDINPQAKIHVLVVPKRKAKSLNDLRDWDPKDVGIFFQKVADVAHHLGVGTHGYRVVVNTGAGGGQSVDYVHAHILSGELSGDFA